MTHAKEEFDEEYEIVRRAVVRGKYTGKYAKLWLKKRAALAAIQIEKERMARFLKQVGYQPDRELEDLKEYTKELKKQFPLEDDDEDGNDE